MYVVYKKFLTKNGSISQYRTQNHRNLADDFFFK